MLLGVDGSPSHFRFFRSSPICCRAWSPQHLLWQVPLPSCETRQPLSLRSSGSFRRSEGKSSELPLFWGKEKTDDPLQSDNVNSYLEESLDLWEFEAKLKKNSAAGKRQIPWQQCKFYYFTFLSIGAESRSKHQRNWIFFFMLPLKLLWNNMLFLLMRKMKAWHK